MSNFTQITAELSYMTHPIFNTATVWVFAIKSSFKKVFLSVKCALKQHTMSTWLYFDFSPYIKSHMIIKTLLLIQILVHTILLESWAHGLLRQILLFGQLYRMFSISNHSGSSSGRISIFSL